MRLIKCYILISITFTSLNSIGQFSIEELTLIKDSIHSELNDSIKSKWVINDLSNILITLDDQDSLFPFSEFDSAFYFTYGIKYKKFDPGTWNKVYKDHILTSKKLTQNQINLVLKTINNPLNFKWGECGTPFIEGAIIFYKQGKEIAQISHACSGGQLFTSPNSILIRWGAFNEKGYDKFYQIINAINLKK